MGSREKIENLRLIYTVCLKELNLAKTNIEKFIDKVNEQTSFILAELTKFHDTPMYLLAYDHITSELMHTADFVRKFNIRCEMKMLNSHDEHHLKGRMIMKPVPDDNHEHENKEQFTYTKPDLSKFEINYKTDCYITHVKNKTEKLFYIILHYHTNDNPEYIKCVKVLDKFKYNSPILDHYPLEGEVFGIIIEDYMFRAVRENDQYCRNTTTDSYNAFLIDTGEVVTITSDTKIYYIPYECRKIPSQAIPCKLIMVNSEKNVNLGEYLADHLHMKDKLIVLKKEDSIVHVNLVGDTNPFTNHSLEVDNTTTEKPDQLITGFFNSFYPADGNKRTNLNENAPVFNYVNNTLTEQRVDYNNFEDIPIVNEENNQQQFNYSPTNTKDDSLNANAHLVDNADNTSSEFNDTLSLDSLNNDNLTCIKSNEPDDVYNFNTHREKVFNFNYFVNQKSDSSDKFELLERCLAVDEGESFQTTNALKAILGYVPKDEQRICPFYDPKTKSCFKGSRCKFEHVEKIEDGWTLDQAETIINIQNKLILPSIGETVNLFATCIINMENIYAQFCSNGLLYQSEVSELILKMNSPKETVRFTVLDSRPTTFQLVIAKYKDNLWYRAKILEIIDDITFKVFYVDFGDTNTIRVDQIRKWEKRFEYLPFQAIKCKISGIEAKKEDYLRNSGIEQLKRMISNRLLTARIVNIIDEDILLVQLYDEQGYNVGERLVTMGYSNVKQMKFFGSNVRTPG